MNRISPVIGYCSILSYWCFVALVFSLGASLPAGFLSTFSWLCFLFAVPSAFRNFKSMRFDYREINIIIGIALMVVFYLAITSSKLFSNPMDTIVAINEFRLFFFFPIIFLGFISLPKEYLKRVIVVFSFGCLISLILSYYLYFLGETNQFNEPVRRSLGNRIYHGILMVTFFAIILGRYRCYNTVPQKFFLVFIGCLIVFNIFNVEIGRTAYFSLVSMLLWFIFLSSRFRHSMILSFGILMALILFYFLFDNFQLRLIETYAELNKMFKFDDFSSSPSIRFELYRWGSNALIEGPFFGVGVDSLDMLLQQASDNGDLRVPTDNIHNEYLNFGLIGGFPLVILLLLFLGSLVRYSLTLEGSRGVGLSSIFLAFCVHLFFNSGIKDLGEKTLLTALIVVLCWSIVSRKQNVISKDG